MNRIEVVWCEVPDEEDQDDTDRYICFRLRDSWFAVDSDQLILPITLTERNGTTLDDPVPAILKQYGGEGLLNDMLLSDQDLEAGTEWMLSTTDGFGRTIEPISTE